MNFELRDWQYWFPIASADAVVIPTRAGGVEFSPVLITLEMIPAKTARGVVICAARLGTNDLCGLQ